MDAHSIRFVTFRSKSAYCLGPTVQLFSRVAKPRRLSLRRWAPATTCSALKGSKAKPRSASCFTTTSHRFRLEKSHSCGVREDVKLEAVLQLKGQFPRFIFLWPLARTRL